MSKTVIAIIVVVILLAIVVYMLKSSQITVNVGRTVSDNGIIVCTDSDEGTNHAVKGKVVKTVSGEVEIEKEDECDELGRLVEYYCFDQGNYRFDKIDCEAGFACVDGACIEKQAEEPPAGTPSNLVANPGFEDGGGSSAASWSLASSHERASDKAHSGTYSIKSLYTNPVKGSPKPGVATVSNSITVKPGTRYTLSGWIYYSYTGGTANAYIDLSDIPEECSAVHKSKNTWESVSCDFTTGASTTSVVIRLVTDGNIDSGNVWFDDVELKAV